MRSVVVCLLLAAPLCGQDPRGAIVGQISDSTGAVIPGASVRATNLDTNVVTRAASNAQGNYELPYLLPGYYSLNAELTGFKSWTQAKIELRTGDRLRVDTGWSWATSPRWSR